MGKHSDPIKVISEFLKPVLKDSVKQMALVLTKNAVIVIVTG